MPIFNNILAGAAGQAGGAAAYEIERSLRFNSGDSAYLNRTPTSNGNQKTATWSFWVKRAALGVETTLFGFGATSTTDGMIQFTSGDVLQVFFRKNATKQVDYKTAALFRDTSAWYHIVVRVDTTVATTVKIWVNGAEVSNWAATPTNATVDDTLILNNTGYANYIGKWRGDTNPDTNAYLADVHFIDGQALDASSFGALDSNGVWQAAEYSGTYGTNGFHLLDFANESTLGHDSSGNENDFTANNFSTSGTGTDIMVDVPTNGDSSDDTGAGGEVSGNYATLNPLTLGNATLSNGNLDCNIGASNGKWGAASTIGVTSGKFYIEVKCVNAVHGNTQIGIGDSEHIIKSHATEQVGTAGQAVYYRSADGNRRVYTNGTSSDSAYGNTYTQDDIIGIALNADDQEVTFYKNGTAQDSGTAISIPTTSQAIFLSLGEGSSDGPDFECNFGQRAYTYTAPSGYKALCTTNLSPPTIADGSDYFDTKLYDGTGAAQTVSGLSFSPDLAWLKRRSSTESNTFFDIVRGAGKELISDSSSGEYDAGTGSSGSLIAFNSDGFDLGTRSSVNGSSTTNVAWAWDAGSSTDTNNTDGSITPTGVRANQTAGFSIVSYTGNGGASATIGHGLNAAPEMIIVKNRDVADHGVVYHVGTDATTPQNYFLKLFETSGGTAARSDTGAMWNDTAPTSSVFSVGTEDNVNASTENYIAYCFTSVAGYSAFGSLTTNGSADGTFTYTGFRPAFILYRYSNTTGNWAIFDSKRSTYNVMGNYLLANSSASEASSDIIDFLSNGFKFRTALTSGNTIIYACFAENPFQANGGLAR